MYPSTPFLHTDGPFFYVDLVDMSVNNVRLNVSPGTFDRDDDREGGVLTDTGAPISFLAPAAYDLLVVELKKVIDQLGAPYYPPQKRGFGPCWGAKDLDTGTFPFPRIPWHFRDGNSLEINTAGSYVL
ncbi:hypothetical protein Mapa_002982 [Marchantia paleacea]|nr:hypothetical protein Mapa_002982 [Marchantia paleacea]